MFRRLTLTVAFAAITTASLAADLPVRAAASEPFVAPPVFAWTGFYIGANGGYAWDNSRTSYTGGPTMLNVLASGALPSSLPVKKSNFIGGLQLGYNLQFNNIVFGVEGDVNFLNTGGRSATTGVNNSIIHIAGTRADFGSGSEWFATTSAQRNWIATLRGRLGFSIDRALIFVTGGLAFSDIKVGGTLNRFYPVGGVLRDSWSGSTSLNSVGWVLGGGVEYAITNNWSVKGEALYYDFGKKTGAMAESW
jgi:outer membrane immunogenic protein